VDTNATLTAAVQEQSVRLGELAAEIYGLSEQVAAVNERAVATAAIDISLASDNCSEKITSLSTELQNPAAKRPVQVLLLCKAQ
jgi:uncharacterized protein YoxC